MQKTIFTFIILLSTPVVFAADSTFDFLMKNDKNYDEVLVQEVITPDTIVIENYLKKGERIRLAGIKAPEVKKKVMSKKDFDKYGFPIEEEVVPTDTIEEDALKFVQRLLEGKKVRVEFDQIKKNAKYETIGYVFLIDDATFVNTEILRQGYAQLQIIPENKKYIDQLRAAYQEAHAEKRGLQGQ